MEISEAGTEGAGAGAPPGTLAFSTRPDVCPACRGEAEGCGLCNETGLLNLGATATALDANNATE